MIIGISGYAGSGKDTIGQMIQWIHCYNTTGITMEEAIDNHHKHVDWMQAQSGWEIKKYAGKLKKIAALLLGVEEYKFEQEAFKKSQLGAEWGHMSVRTFLQRLGTEAMRDGLHQDVWGNALWVDYKEFMRWVVTDVRFANEAQRIKDMGGIIIRVNRLNNEPINRHISETALDNWRFDYVIDNNENLETLFLDVCRMLQKFNMYRNQS